MNVRAIVKDNNIKFLNENKCFFPGHNNFEDLIIHSVELNQVDVLNWIF